MHLERKTISVLTTTGKSYTGYAGPFNGLVHAVEYVISTSAVLSSTADLAITTEVTGHNILASLTVGAASFVKYPRSTTVNSTNGTSTGADKIPVVGERVKLAISASSAANLTGTYHIYVEGGTA